VNNFLAYIIYFLNIITNAIGKVLIAPLITHLPGWLSNTIISAVTGVAILFVFKYTSNQKAIGNVKDRIKANTLAIKLYKDYVSVTLLSLARVLKGTFAWLFHSIRPILVMMIPFSLLFGQMWMWYQARPLLPGEQAIVTMKLNGDTDSKWPQVSIASLPGAEITIEKTKVLSKRQLYWKIKAADNGCHSIRFKVDNDIVEKQLAVGNGFMRTSSLRPGWKFSDMLLYPFEKPFKSDSIVKSIRIRYPDRISKTSGTNWWIAYLLVISSIFFLLLKPVFKVNF